MATKIRKDKSGDRLVVRSGGEFKVESGGLVNMESGAIQLGVVQNLRTRTLLAAVITGVTLLPAVAGYKYRLIDVKMIATVANAATATSVDITGTQAAGAALLVVNAVGALTESTVVVAGVTANSAVLDDGASFEACDANTAITMIDKGTDLTGPTAIDTIITYVVEAA